MTTRANQGDLVGRGDGGGVLAQRPAYETNCPQRLSQTPCSSDSSPYRAPLLCPMCCGPRPVSVSVAHVPEAPRLQNTSILWCGDTARPCALACWRGPSLVRRLPLDKQPILAVRDGNWAGTARVALFEESPTLRSAVKPGIPPAQHSPPQRGPGARAVIRTWERCVRNEDKVSHRT